MRSILLSLLNAPGSQNSQNRPLGARREGIDVGGRGQGLPFMIKLIERAEARGRLFVVSGKAAARFESGKLLTQLLICRSLQIRFAELYSRGRFQTGQEEIHDH